MNFIGDIWGERWCYISVRGSGGDRLFLSKYRLLISEESQFSFVFLFQEHMAHGFKYNTHAMVCRVYTLIVNTYPEKESYRCLLEHLFHTLSHKVVSPMFLFHLLVFLPTCYIIPCPSHTPLLILFPLLK